MATEIRQRVRRFTAEEYLRMAEAGVFGEDERVELLEGEVIEMSPQGKAHVKAVERVNEVLVLAYAGSEYAVRPQSTHRAGSRSVPEPDLAVVARSATGLVDVGESALLVEVSDSTLVSDRTQKRRIYAEADAPRYWIVEIPERQVRVLEDPDAGDYRSERVVGEEGVLTLPVVGSAIAVADILPPH